MASAKSPAKANPALPSMYLDKKVSSDIVTDDCIIPVTEEEACGSCGQYFAYDVGIDSVHCPSCLATVAVKTPEDTLYEMLDSFRDHFTSPKNALVWLATAVPTRSWKLSLPKASRLPRSNGGKGGYATSFFQCGLHLRKQDTKSGHWHYWYLLPHQTEFFKTLQRALLRRWKESPAYVVVVPVRSSPKVNHIPREHDIDIIERLIPALIQNGNTAALDTLALVMRKDVHHLPLLFGISSSSSPASPAAPAASALSVTPSFVPFSPQTAPINSNKKRKSPASESATKKMKPVFSPAEGEPLPISPCDYSPRTLLVSPSSAFEPRKTNTLTPPPTESPTPPYFHPSSAFPSPFLDPLLAFSGVLPSQFLPQANPLSWLAHAMQAGLIRW